MLVTGLQVGIATVGLVTVSRISSLASGFSALTAVVFSAAAAWLLVAGRRDPRARTLALLFLLTANAFSRQFLAPLADYNGILEIIVRGVFPDAFLPWSMWSFARHFPRTVRYSFVDSVCKGGQRVSLLIGLVLFATNIAIQHGSAVSLAWLQRSAPAGTYWTIVLMAALPVPPVIWLRARWSSLQERRRLALFSACLAGGLLPVILEIVAELTVPAFRNLMEARGYRAYLSPLFFGMLLAIPVGTGYAVLVDHVLDVPVFLGRALQSLLARTTILVLTGVPVAGLAWYAYANRHLTITELVTGPGGATLGSAALLSMVLAVVRRPALALVDRWFLRDRVDLGAELPRLAAAIRNTRSIEEIAETVASEAAASLRAEFVTLRLAPGVGDGNVAGLMPEGGALESLLDADSSPLIVDDEDERSVYALLPQSDRAWVMNVKAAVVTPVLGTLDRLLAVLLAGRKRSGEAFGREDLSFMATVASAAALAIEAHREQSSAETLDEDPLRECRNCGRVHATGVERCVCGSSCRIASVPRVLAGKFRVDRFLGSGGMGVVYRAEDIELGRPVALKTLPRISGRAADQLEREARMMAAVAHPNLATIFGIERWKSTPTLVIEFFDGGTLEPRIGTPQPVNDVLRLGTLLAPALQQLHESGMLHRDIKPSNIAFTRTGVPKLLDFGLASLLSAGRSAAQQAQGDANGSATQSVIIEGRLVAGTPLYLSPEAAAGAEPAPDFDVWALALVLYELIAGTNPFTAGRVEDVLIAVRRAEVASLRTHRPDCSPEVANAFERFLGRRRAQRPASAAEFGGSLEQLLSLPVRT
jgi:hypothetical protein